MPFCVLLAFLRVRSWTFFASHHLTSTPLTSPHLPHLASPHLTSPHLILSHLASPHLISPHLTYPHLTSPRLTSPHLTSPHLTSPHLASPHLASPHLTSPHLTSPHLTCPTRKQQIERPWYRADDPEDRNAKAKRAYEALMTVTLRKPDSADYRQFSREVKARAHKDYGKTIYDVDEVSRCNAAAMQWKLYCYLD